MRTLKLIRNNIYDDYAIVIICLNNICEEHFFINHNFVNLSNKSTFKQFFKIFAK